MPASKKMLNAARLKANRLAGLGDKDGRIVRVKESVSLLKCTVCNVEIKPTKTNSEIKAHSEKEGKGIEICFPGATKVMESLIAKVGASKKKHNGKVKATKMTKAEKKAAELAMFAEFDTGKKKKKKKKSSKK